MKSGARNTGDLNRLRFGSLLACCLYACPSFGDAAIDQDISVPQRHGTTWRSTVVLEQRPLTGMTQSGAHYSLADLTDLALRNNPSTREAWAAAKAQAAAVGVADAEYWPTLDATVGLSRGKSAINSSSGVISSNVQTRLSSTISLSYTLFDFGLRAASSQAASYGLLAANLTQNRVLQDVVLQVEQVYYQLLAARQTIVAAEETLKTLQVSFDVASSRRRAGLATIGDVYQAETALAQSRLQLRRAQGEAGKLQGTLCNAVGLPVNSVLKLAALDAPAPVREVQRTIDDYLNRAKVARPDLSAAEAQSRAAHAAIDAAAAQHYPTIDVTASAGSNYNDFQPGGGNSGSTTGTIGINLRIPIFSGLRTSNTVSQARAKAEQSDAARERVALRIELEVWQAYFDLDTAVSAIDSARALMRSAGQAREFAQARYQAGVGNLLELLSAQSSEANARMEVIQAEMGWYSSLSRLNNAIGDFASK